MSALLERLARAVIVSVFGASSVEHDIITDYLDIERPAWRSAWQAFRCFFQQKLVQVVRSRAS